MPDGTTVRLVDENLEPVPPGLVGEILIGGATLALGYNHQPRRSAEIFIADVWSEAPGQRLYRTGEFARRRNDGRLELRGRRDGRVRIAGQRVELKEIEAALVQQPGVKDAAVLALATGTAEAISVSAFVVAAEDAGAVSSKAAAVPARTPAGKIGPSRVLPRGCSSAVYIGQSGPTGIDR